MNDIDMMSIVMGGSMCMGRGATIPGGLDKNFVYICVFV